VIITEFGVNVSGTLTLNGTAANTTICLNSTVAVAQGTGQIINGGSYWYWIGFDADNSGWINGSESWNMLNQQQANNASFTTAAFGSVGQWVVHSNGTNACGTFGAGVTRYVQVVQLSDATGAGTISANGITGAIDI